MNRLTLSLLILLIGFRISNAMEMKDDPKIWKGGKYSKEGIYSIKIPEGYLIEVEKAECFQIRSKEKGIVIRITHQLDSLGRLEEEVQKKIRDIEDFKNTNIEGQYINHFVKDHPKNKNWKVLESTLVFEGMVYKSKTYFITAGKYFLTIEGSCLPGYEMNISMIDRLVSTIK